MLRKAQIRAREIYVCYVLAGIVLVALVQYAGESQLDWGSWAGLLHLSLPVAVVKVATLLYQPNFLEILPMYCLFLLGTPVVLGQLEKGNCVRVGIISVSIWGMAQFGIHKVLLGLVSPFVDIRPGYFNSFAWQILFVTGLICGHKTFTAKASWLPAGWKLPALASVVALIFFSLQHHNLLGINVDNRLIERSFLGPLRLLNFACIAFLICRLRGHIEKYIAWRGFAFLSKNSLQVFAFHLFPIYLVGLALGSKTSLPVSAQLLVIGFCIMALFQIAFLAQLFKDFRSRFNAQRRDGFVPQAKLNMKQAQGRLFSYYVLCLAFPLMLVEWARGYDFSNPSLQSIQKDFIHLTLSKSGQLPIVIGLAAWCLGLLWLKIQLERHRAPPKRGLWGVLKLRDKCKVLLVVCSVLVCALMWTNAPQSGDSEKLLLGIDQSTNVMVFLFGIVLSQIIENVLIQTKGKEFSFIHTGLASIVLFLAATSLIQASIPHIYKYHAQIRWTGLWVNPNTYGLLMGLGMGLALGLGFSSFKFQVSSLRVARFRGGKMVLCAVAVGVMSMGLLLSYSRGAWLAFFCGLFYLTFQAIRISGNSKSKAIQWIYHNGITLAVVVFALVLLAFWQFRDTEHRIARRAFSVSNANDFSLRNRAAAWKGALMMIADKPRFGFGWNQPEPMYDNYYRTPIVEGGMAIQLNDYCTLGMTLGLPALLCFLVYIWLSLSRWPSSLRFTSARRRVESREQMEEGGGQKSEAMIEKSEIRNPKSEIAEMDWLQIICRAGVIVLLVGFWFDGGLFKLALAVPFWILIELGSAKSGWVQPKAAVPL